MYLFMDESGDLGFNFINRSPSRYFTILACNTRVSLQLVRSSIRQTLNRKINHRSRYKKHELKGRELMLPIKQYFFNRMGSDNHCKLYSVVFDKIRMNSGCNNVDVHRLYNRLSLHVFEKLVIPASSTFIHITVDKCKSGLAVKDFNRCIQAHFERMLSPIRITIEHLRSEEDLALQAVDLFAYGIFRKYEMADYSWYDIFRNKIVKEEVIELQDDGPRYAMAPQIIESS